MSKTALPLILAIDTREQTPWSEPHGFESRRIAMKSGDYSVLGFEDRIAVERKTLADFVACCLPPSRPRFERELARLAELPFACVVVEATLLDVYEHRYLSAAHPRSILGSALAFSLDHVPVYFCGDRETASDFGWRFVLKAHKRITSEAEVAA